MKAEERNQLESWIRAKTSSQLLAFRARICNLAADGLSNNEITKRLNTSRPTVLLWRNRFLDQGPKCLTINAKRGPSPRRLDQAKVRTIGEVTLHSTPPDATHWSTKTMAKAQGVCGSSVARIWKAHGLKPHRIETFCMLRSSNYLIELEYQKASWPTTIAGG